MGLLSRGPFSRGPSLSDLRWAGPPSAPRLGRAQAFKFKMMVREARLRCRHLPWPRSLIPLGAEITDSLRRAKTSAVAELVSHF